MFHDHYEPGQSGENAREDPQRHRPEEFSYRRRRGTQAPLLARDIPVIRWDRRGPYSLARSVADLDAVRVHLGLSQMAVLGHSRGATLALRYALDHPDRVSALIYASGTGLGWA